jgi:cell division protein FtsL
MAHAASTSIGRARVLERKGNDGLVTSVLFTIAILVSASLFYTWSRVEVVKIGYEIFNANAEMRRLDQENKELILEIATLKSPKRIERIAREELGLIPPKEEQTVILR